MQARGSSNLSRNIVSTLFSAIFIAGLSGCGPTYPKCETDEHCAEKGEYCVDGTCQQCREDSQCPEGQQCKGGRCEVKPECTSDSDCKDNMVCRSGKCKIECTSDSDCGRGYKCSDNRCVDALACSVDRDCPTGMTCQNGRCATENVSRGFCANPPPVYFDFNIAEIRADQRGTLEELANCFKNDSGTVTVEGHCDERGTEEYNLALGDRRANAVVKYLVRLGVPKNKLRAVSKGELQPADSRSTEDAWAKNRRAEFVR